MNLVNAKLGEVYEVFNSRFNLDEGVMGTTQATIIATNEPQLNRLYDNHFLLGWREKEQPASTVKLIELALFGPEFGEDCLSNIRDFKWAYWVRNDCQVYSRIDAGKPLSRECPCGIFRGDCSYHRIG